MKPFLLALDQGTTSTRAILFDEGLRPLHTEQVELEQHFPRDGWVEHDAEEIWQSSLSVLQGCVAAAGETPVAAIGITNQRETAVIWDRATGRPIHRAIVWQDRRGAARCRALAQEGTEPLVQARTGLVLDSYFSATKAEWLLDHVEGARAAAGRGDLAFGTIDSFLLWRLTGGRVHATDASNAARTMLFDIGRQAWDDELLRLFRVPPALLPEVRDNAGRFGETEPALLGRAIPIAGMAGDQQAATIGQACFAPGMVKSTYGTGCFMLANTGTTRVSSRHRLLATVAWRLGGRTVYALEGSIFNAGTTVKWLRDKLGLIRDAGETAALAASVDGTRGAYLVPAFTGLGAPHWDPDARGALIGLTRDTGRAEIVRAALEAVAYQTRDLVDAMLADGVPAPPAIRVDGGMVGNRWLLQFLADLLGTPIERPAVTETTALGAAALAGLGIGLFGSLDDIAARVRPELRVTPAMPAETASALHDGWRRALARTRSS